MCVDAIDPDQGNSDGLRYRISRGDPQSFFKIDSKTGPAGKEIPSSGVKMAPTCDRLEDDPSATPAGVVNSFGQTPGTPVSVEEGESLLSLACSAGYYELAQVLLAMRTNIEDRGSKGDCTPLMEAGSAGHLDIVKLLIAHGADVNAQSSTGCTPLMYACGGGHEQVVNALLEADADVEIRNENGHCPLMEAASAANIDRRRGWRMLADTERLSNEGLEELQFIPVTDTDTMKAAGEADKDEESDDDSGEAETMMSSLKVTVIGSGNWGSAISIVIGGSVVDHIEFEKIVKMWVFEETVDGKKLTDIINTRHENVKYLPGKQLPENILAVPDLIEAVKDADILVFVIPHQFIERTCATIKDKIKPTAIGVSLIEEIKVLENGEIKLISRYITETLGIETGVLMGADLAVEVAGGDFCEATIGCKSDSGRTLKKLFHTRSFRIVVVKDDYTVELCGALQNIVACAAGFADGLKYGHNTEAAIFRLGVVEMLKFVQYFYHAYHQESFVGISDLYASCIGGRNRRCCEALVKTGKPIDVLEKEMLNGQQLQGQHTAALVHQLLVAHNLVENFPLFDAVHRICAGQLEPQQLIACLSNEPEHSKQASEPLKIKL